jgi:hypothetical protein
VDTLAVVAREKPESLSPELVQFARRVRDGSIPQDQADVLLRRATCISDDVFGHWLQSLAGRKIIVVLDSCFSGGFSASEKGALNQEPALSDRFDFLDGEVSRLKDIGQGNAVMLAACSKSELAQEFKESGLSVMTYYLVDAIQTAQARVTVDYAYRVCETAMAAHFARARDNAPHRPYLFGDGHDAILRP